MFDLDPADLECHTEELVDVTEEECADMQVDEPASDARQVDGKAAVRDLWCFSRPIGHCTKVLKDSGVYNVSRLNLTF